MVGTELLCGAQAVDDISAANSNARANLSGMERLKGLVKAFALECCCSLVASCLIWLI